MAMFNGSLAHAQGLQVRPHHDETSARLHSDTIHGPHGIVYTFTVALDQPLAQTDLETGAYCELYMVPTITPSGFMLAIKRPFNTRGSSKDLINKVGSSLPGFSKHT